MTTEPDKDVEAIREALAYMPYTRPTKPEALEALASLEERLRKAEAQDG